MLKSEKTDHFSIVTGPPKYMLQVSGVCQVLYLPAPENLLDIWYRNVVNNAISHFPSFHLSVRLSICVSVYLSLCQSEIRTYILLLLIYAQGGNIIFRLANK